MIGLLRLGIAAALPALAMGLAVAAAQIPSPPQTLIGSVADEAGPVPAGLTIEAYIGDKLCGTGRTELVGDGSPKTTVYYVDVFSAQQMPGCGEDGKVVRLKVGDRFADETARWRAGLLQLDITFGNIQPAPIPTATPTPTRTVAAGTAAPGATGTPAPNATPATNDPSGSATAVGTLPAGSEGSRTATPLQGGVTSSSGPGGGGGDDGGVPLWGVVMGALGVIGVAGVAVGIVMARARRGAAA